MSTSDALRQQLREQSQDLPRFWSAIARAFPGTEPPRAHLYDVRAQHPQDWAIIQGLFVTHCAMVEDVMEWGALGLDVEAAVRARVVIQSAAKRAQGPGGRPWPPRQGGRATAPLTLLELGQVIAARRDIPLGAQEWTRWCAADWQRHFREIVGVAGVRARRSPMLDDDHARRAQVRLLDATVEAWVHDGPIREAGARLWVQLGDTGLEDFLESHGASCMDHGELEAELRGAVARVWRIGAGDLIERVRWLASLRTALRGELAVRAAEEMAAFRPWAHDEVLGWLRELLG